MPALKPGTILPTDEEDAAIMAAARSDPDAAPILTDEEWARIKPRLRVGHPPGRPSADRPKAAISIRLSPDVIEYFKAGGPGWQTRIDAALREYVRSHPVG